ncbi:hypothetical protein GQ457_01G030900 [Hibiscus cannabinus]
MFNPRNKSIITSFFNTLRIVTNNHSLSNNNPSLFFAVRSISKTSTTRNLTISYLRNEIGFSEKSAVEASRVVKLKTTEKPDSVVEFLEKQGCSKTQIREIIRSEPRLLKSDVEDELLPKIQFFQGKAVSDPDIFKILFKSKLIGADLEEKIVPWFNILSSLLESNSKVIAAIKKKPSLIRRKFNAERLSFPIQGCLGS